MLGESDQVYESLLFDMDGVLIDTQEAVTDFWRQLAGQHQVQLAASDFDRFIYGSPAADTLDVLFPHLTLTQRGKAIRSLAAYEQCLTYQAMPGVKEFLYRLQDKRLTTALVTSGDSRKAAEVIRQLGFDGVFAVIVTADDVTQGKPDPQCYLKAAERLDVAPEDCLVFEDSINGVKAAVSSGATCIGVASLERAQILRRAGAMLVIEDFRAARLETLSGRTLGSHRLRLDSSQVLLRSKG